MEGEAKTLVREMMASIETWVKEIVGEAETVTDAAGAKHLEQRIAREGQRHLGRLLQGVLQLALDHQPDGRVCPHCGGRRRHRGRRTRGAAEPPRTASPPGGVLALRDLWHGRACGGLAGRRDLDALDAGVGDAAGGGVGRF